MALLTPTNIDVSGSVTLTQNVLTASDTFTYKQGSRQSLQFVNNTGGLLTINILGDLATTVNCSGLGDPIDVSTGYDVSVPNDGIPVTVRTETIKAYLTATNNLPAVTGGTGAECYILEG